MVATTLDGEVWLLVGSKATPLTLDTGNGAPAAWRPRSNTIAAMVDGPSGNSGVSLFDASTGRHLRRWEGRAQPEAISWSSDGRYLAIDADPNTVLVLDGNTGRLLSRQHAEVGLPFVAPVFAPGGDRLAVATKDGIEERTLAGKPLAMLVSGIGKLPVAYGPHQTLLYLDGSANELRVLNPRTGATRDLGAADWGGVPFASISRSGEIAFVRSISTARNEIEVATANGRPKELGSNCP